MITSLRDGTPNSISVLDLLNCSTVSCALRHSSSTSVSYNGPCQIFWPNSLGLIDPLVVVNFSVRLINEALIISLILYYAYISTMGVFFLITGIPMKLAWCLQDRHPW